MDALVGLLDGPRARSAFVLRSIMNPPWSVRVQDEAPLSLVAMVRGEAWVVFDDGDRTVLGAGDVVVTRGPDPYLFADDPGTPPQVVILPGQRARRRGDDAHRHLPRPGRDRSAVAARAPSPGRAPRRRRRLAAGSPARG